MFRSSILPCDTHWPNTAKPTPPPKEQPQPNHLGSTHAGRGFPHSEISGSKFVRNSPELIAAYHVLHRLSVPRHPPNALKTLDRSHHQCSPPPAPKGKRSMARQIRPSCFASIRCRRDVRRASPHPPPRRTADDSPQPDECPLHNVKQPASRTQPGNARRQRPSRTPRPAKPHIRQPPQGAPAKPEWWSQTGSNRRPHACKARALPAELWPRRRHAPHPVGPAKAQPQRPKAKPGCTKQAATNGRKWWAWEDLNFRPHAYQARALTN